MLNLSLGVQGAEEFKRTLGLTGNRLKNLSPVWEAWAIDFRAKESYLFDAEGAAQGYGSWAPLSPKYAEQKRRDGFTGGILVRTGKLKASLSSVGAGSITKITPSSLEIGTSIPYAKYHQGGTRRMPARPPIRVTDAQRQFLIKLIQRFAIVGGLREGIGSQRDHF